MSNSIGGKVSNGYVLVVPFAKQNTVSIGGQNYSVGSPQGNEMFGEIINKGEDVMDYNKNEIVQWTRQVQEYKHGEETYIWIHSQDITMSWTKKQFEKWQTNLKTQ